MEQESSENLTARQSLDIIAAMIQEAKGNVQRNNFFFLFWGWVVVLANLGMYALTMLDYQHPYGVWIITVPAWIYTLYKIFTTNKKERSISHFDRISARLWISYSITLFLLVFFGFKINFQLNPVILAISAIPTIVSGTVLNFKPLMIGGLAFWVSAVICFLVPMESQPLIGAVAIACGYLIPGYMLRNRKE